MPPNPARERVGHWDHLAHPVLQTAVKTSELPTETADSDIRAAAGLAVVSLTGLERCTLDALDLGTDALQNLLCQGYQGSPLDRSS